MNNLTLLSLGKKVWVLTSATAIAALGTFAVSSPSDAAVTAPTTGSPDEFILDLDNRGNECKGEYEQYRVANPAMTASHA
jgi:hypothetical protein